METARRHHDDALLADSQVDAEHLSDEDCANTLVDGGTVHIDGGAKRQHEAGDLAANAKLLRTFHVHRKRTHRRSGGEGKRHGAELAFEERNGTHLRRWF